MNYELIKKNFDRGLWNEKQVEIAKNKGVITQEQYKEIVSKKKNWLLLLDKYNYSKNPALERLVL